MATRGHHLSPGQWISEAFLPVLSLFNSYLLLFLHFLCPILPNAPDISKLAGHPRSGCPARLRGHKGSGLWKVWTVPSPPLPSPALPSPSPPSRVPNLIKLGPAVWPKLQPAEARECSAALAISEWTRRLSAMLIIARRKMLF